jgi:cell division protein FtsA
LKARLNDLIVGMDIGSSKIAIAIAEIDELGNLTVLGTGVSEPKGAIRGGMIINIESVAAAVSQAVEDAEIQAGREINGVILGFSGGNIETINSKGMVAISGPEKEINEKDVIRVIDTAKAVSVPMDRQMLHIIPQLFVVDGQRNVKYPIGMVGTRLECSIHILTVPVATLQNAVKCLDRCGIEIYDVVLQNLASAKAVLEDDEREMGSLVIDMGSETSKISVYHQGSPYYNFVYPLGGYLITNDIAAGLKVPLATAENIKLVSGVTHFDYVTKEETIQIPSVGGRKPRTLPRESLVHIIRPRVEEMLNFIKHDITKQGYMDKITGGIVLTGGSSLLPGIVEVCQEIFDIQTRVGMPKKFSGLSERLEQPDYAVLNGLLKWGYDKFSKESEFIKKSFKDEGNKSFIKTIKKLFNELF